MPPSQPKLLNTPLELERLFFLLQLTVFTGSIKDLNPPRYSMSKRRKISFVVTSVALSLFGSWIIMIAEPIAFIGWCLALCAPMFFVEWLWKRHLKKRKERKRVEQLIEAHLQDQADAFIASQQEESHWD